MLEAWSTTEQESRQTRWTRLYEEARPVLYRSAALMVGAAEAEELIQEAFELGTRNPAFFEEIREPIAWLRTVTARRAVSRMRRRLLWNRVKSRLAPEGGTEAWERADLAAALRGLSVRDRVALVLRYYQDASYEEIGSALDLPVSSVGPVLTRARARVREALS